MSEELYRKKTDVFEICTDPEKGYEPLMVTNDGIKYEHLEVTILEKFSEAVKATEKLASMEKSSILDYISDNSDIVSDGLELFMNSTDAVINVHSYLNTIFPDFSDLSTFSNVIVELLLKLAGA